MTFALLYNIILIHTSSNVTSDDEEIPQHAIELMCNCIQVGDEQDKLIRRRKLAIVLRLIRRYGYAAVQLLLDLDYTAHVMEVHGQLESAADDDKTISAEIIHHMTSK